MVDQYIPNKGMTLYIDPLVSLGSIDLIQNKVDIRNLVSLLTINGGNPQNTIQGFSTANPNDHYVNVGTGTENFFSAGYNQTSNSFDSQTSSTYNFRLQFTSGLFGSACEPAFTQANPFGTLMMWLYVSDTNVNESFLIGSGNNCAFSIETNAANTQWRLKGAGGLETTSDNLGPQWSNSIYDQRSTRYSDYYPCNQWHCIVYTIYPIARSRSNEIRTYSAQLFVNDEIDSFVGAFEDANDASPHDNGVDFQIVEMFGSTTNILPHFRGRVGQIAAWDKRPSDNEISSLYHKFKHRYGV